MFFQAGEKGLLRREDYSDREYKQNRIELEEKKKEKKEGKKEEKKEGPTSIILM